MATQGKILLSPSGKRILSPSGKCILSDSGDPCCCAPPCTTSCPTTMNFLITPAFPTGYGGCKDQDSASYFLAGTWSFANVGYGNGAGAGAFNNPICLTWGAPTTGGGIVSRWRWVDPQPLNFLTQWYTATGCVGGFAECIVSGLIWNIIVLPDGRHLITAGNTDYNETPTQLDVGGIYHDCAGVGWPVPALPYLPRDGAFLFWGYFCPATCTATTVVSESDPSAARGDNNFIYGSGFWGTPAPTVTVVAGGC